MRSQPHPIFVERLVRDFAFQNRDGEIVIGNFAPRHRRAELLSAT